MRKKLIKKSEIIYNETSDVLYDVLKRKEYMKLAFSVFLVGLVAFSFLNGFFTIPIIDFGFVRMSSIEFFDILYVVFASLMLAVLIPLIRFKQETTDLGSKATASGGLFAGILGAICPVCQAISIGAFGSTIASLPLPSLVPYLVPIRIFGLGLFGFAIYSVARNIQENKCGFCLPAKKVQPLQRETSPYSEFSYLIDNNLAFGGIIAVIALLIISQIVIANAVGSLSVATPAYPEADQGIISVGGSNLQYGAKLTLKPMPLAVGEQPTISGYKTKVKSLPTISELQMMPSTGDIAQDLANNIIPRGTPWYGQEAGVSFDDPINAQNLWAKGRAIQLSPEQQQRWHKIVNAFTCDYCCGSPQQPTIITRCGCAHAAAAQGMAKWFIKYYGDKYSDEEIYGEMARWYAVWYPGPTVKRIAQELQTQV